MRRLAWRGWLLVIAAALISGGMANAAGGHADKQLRVGYVTPAGATHDQSVGQASYEGFRRAVHRLGLQGRVVEVGAARDPNQAVASLARQRYDLIVFAIGDPEAAERAARAFPKVRFLLSDIPVTALGGGHLKNVETFVLRVQEAGFLAGYLAGLIEKRRPGRDVISSIGGFPIPQVDSFIAGYQAGARRADPGITTLNAYSHDFVGPAKCRSIALAQISRGAGTVFPVAGPCGLGALDTAREKHVWGVGVDVDQSFVGPHILTSVVKRYDVALYTELRALKNGTFRTGGTTSLGLKDDGVGLGRISPKVPRGYLLELDRVRGLIVSGKIRVTDRLR